MTRQIARRQLPIAGGAKTQFLPPDLAERYALMLERPDRLSVADTIAMLDVRESILNEQLQDRLPDYEMLYGLLDGIRMARTDADAGAFDVAADRMADALRVGIASKEVWSELREIYRDRQSAVESERRRIVQERAVVTLDQARALIARLLSIVDLLVEDRQLKARIMREFRTSLQVDGGAEIVG